MEVKTDCSKEEESVTGSETCWGEVIRAALTDKWSVNMT